MKKVLITGCSSGFGFDAARHFAAQGHHVYATMRNVDGKNAQPAAELRQAGAEAAGTLEVLEMDVLSDESVARAMEQTSGVDVVINNAGLGYGGPVEAFSSAEILKQLDLNIVGTARVAKAALPGMRERGEGLIIQVSSTAGRGAFPGFGVYHASKWGLEGMSEAMRYELAPLGIDVVIVEPGPFSTNFFDNMVQPSNGHVAAAYGHVGQFFEGFESQVRDTFANEDAPTDPKVVVEIFDRLIRMPAGQRPLRTIAGLDFGFQALNDAVEPIRKGSLEFMGISDWDGPRG